MSNPAHGDRVPDKLALLLGASGSSSGKIKWSDVDSTCIGDLVHTAAAVGVAVLFGSSRDQGALALTFFWQGGSILGKKDGRKTVYCGAGQDPSTWVDGWTSAFAEASTEAP